MKFDYKVKCNGEYYEAGQDVPIGEPHSIREAKDNEEIPFSDEDIQLESEAHMYTYDELEQMSAKEIRKIAEDKGFKLTKTIKDDLINEFLSKQ